MFARGEIVIDGSPLRRGGRPKSLAPKKMVNHLRLDPDVLAYVQADGPGWQTRINETLRKAAGLEA